MKTNKLSSTPLETVNYVDLSRYQGTWYEIARYPNRFQQGCRDSRATYTLLNDGKVSVLNECYDEKSGRLRKANAALESYLTRLTSSQQPGAQFYARADNLADWLAIVAMP